MDGREQNPNESPGASMKLRAWADSLMLGVLFIVLACASPLGGSFAVATLITDVEAFPEFASILPRWGFYIGTALCSIAALALMLRARRDSTAIVLRPLGKPIRVWPSTAHIVISALLLWLSSIVLGPRVGGDPSNGSAWLIAIPAAYFFGSLAFATLSLFEGPWSRDRVCRPRTTKVHFDTTGW